MRKLLALLFVIIVLMSTSCKNNTVNMDNLENMSIVDYEKNANSSDTQSGDAITQNNSVPSTPNSVQPIGTPASTNEAVDVDVPRMLEFSNVQVELQDLVIGDYKTVDTGVGILELAEIEGGYVEVERDSTGMVWGIYCYIYYEREPIPFIDDIEDENQPSVVVVEQAAPDLQSMYDFAALIIGRELTDEESSLIAANIPNAIRKQEPAVLQIGDRTMYLSYSDNFLCLS